MGFDPIMMAMINRLTKGGGAGYVSTEVVEILPETQVQYNNSDGITCPANTPVVLGKTYSVLWDGVKYNCTCVDFTLEGQILLYLGNTAALGGADTGEPFAILAQVVEGMCGLNIVGCVDENDHTCSIMGEAETVHTIDPKFIPGAVLPVVDLSVETISAMINAGETTAKDEEAAAIISAKEQGKAICINATVGLRKFSTFANLVPTALVNHDVVYKADFGAGIVQIITNDDGTVTIKFTANG